jgi:hypothetical protein
LFLVIDDREKRVEMSFENQVQEQIYSVLGNFSNYLNELSFKHRLISASTASAFMYSMRDEIYLRNLTQTDILFKFKTAFELISKIEEENEKISTTNFWTNVIKIKKSLRNRVDIEIILNYLVQAIEDVNVELELDSEEQLHIKKHIQIGRSDKEEHGNDIVFKDDKTLSRVHLVITVSKGMFFIEDRSANGTFINGVKIEKGVKQLIKAEDEVSIGREGTIVNFNDEQIQSLLG